MISQKPSNHAKISSEERAAIPDWLMFCLMLSFVLLSNFSNINVQNSPTTVSKEHPSITAPKSILVSAAATGVSIIERTNSPSPNSPPVVMRSYQEPVAE